MGKYSRYLIKLDRVAAWTMLVTIIAFLVTGYGMTKGFMDVKLATYLHTAILTKVLMLAISIHAVYAIHLSFKRWGIWNNKGKIILALGYAVFLMFFLFVEVFYGKLNKLSGSSLPAPKAPTSTTQTEPRKNDGENDEDSYNAAPATKPNATNPSITPTSQTFTTAQLTKYNGQNGQPAYVAVDGDVYDVSNLFFGGRHHMHFAGQDLTGAFYSQHVKKKLQNYPIVGKLQG